MLRRVGSDHLCLFCVFCSYVFVSSIFCFVKIRCYCLVVLVGDVISLHVYGGCVGFLVGLLRSLLFGALVPTLRTLQGYCVG